MESSVDSENFKPSARKHAPGSSSQHTRNRPKTPKKVTASWLHNSGLYYLQRFSASTAHFRTVMMRKIDLSCRTHTDQNRDDCTRMLDDMIADFVRQGLLNDRAYAETAILSLRRRGLSRRAIMTRLQAKGMDTETLATLLDQQDTEDGRSTAEDGDLHAALRLARRRRIGPYTTVDKEIDRDKAIATLGRAGFTYGIARAVVDMTAEELEDFI